MKRTTLLFLSGIFLVAGLVSLQSVNGKTPAKEFNYAAQKNFIPADLGKIYLGMPFDKFAGEIDLKNAEVGDTRFDWLELSVPVSKGYAEKLKVRIHGLSPEDKQAMLRKDTVMKKDDLGGEYEVAVARLIVDKITSKGFVYAMYIDFKKGFDLKSYVIKTYGKDGEVRKSDDPYHIFDIQWNKKTPDGLNWLIRSFHEDDKKSLQLLGRIENTEWEIDN